MNDTGKGSSSLGENERNKQGGNGNGGDGGGGDADLHPLINGLIKSLPTDVKEPWTIEKRAKWLRAAAQNFDLIYPDTGDDYIDIKIQRGTAREFIDLS